MRPTLHLLCLCVACVVTLCATGKAAAQGPAGKAGAGAVGQIEIDGMAFCTGVLVSQGALLTAAHCLFDPETGARLPESRMTFRPGGAAARVIERAEIHPSFVYHAGPGPERIRHDLAVLRLGDGPAGGGGLPLRIGALPVAGAAVVIPVGAMPSHVPDRCEVTLEERGLLVLSCAASFGASGAPVLAMAEDGPRLVALVAARARANGVPVSLGAGLAPLRDWLERSAAPEPGG